MGIVSRLGGDEDFNRDFGRALESGDAAALEELVSRVGATEVSLTRVDGDTRVNFKLGLVACVTIAIRVCRRF